MHHLVKSTVLASAPNKHPSPPPPPLSLTLGKHCLKLCEVRTQGDATVSKGRASCAREGEGPGRKDHLGSISFSVQTEHKGLRL